MAREEVYVVDLESDGNHRELVLTASNGQCTFSFGYPLSLEQLRRLHAKLELELYTQRHAPSAARITDFLMKKIDLAPQAVRGLLGGRA